MEALERPKAEERMRNLKPTSETFSEVPLGQTRDIVGAAVGMSGVTYQRAKALATLKLTAPSVLGDRG